MEIERWRAAIGRIGVWVSGTVVHHHVDGSELASRLEEMRVGALWVGGGNLVPAEFEQRRAMLASTRRLVVATGITSIWAWDPSDLHLVASAISGDFPGRFLLGLGVSHAPLVEKIGATYDRPVTAMRRFLDGLDAATVTSGNEVDRVLAALGPTMLGVSRDRSLGAHPYLVTPEHTGSARAVLGPDRLLAPEQAVVMTVDPEQARATARGYLKHYLILPNYQSSLAKLGFGDDLTGGGSDRLVDRLIPWGNAESVAARVSEHFDAGADHVCIQPLQLDSGVDLEGLSELLAALTSNI